MQKLALMLAVLAASSLAGAAGAASGTAHLYIAAQCRKPAIMPREVILACADDNLCVTSLKYRQYGSKTASASGRFHQNACIPDCVAGHFHTYAGTIVFADIVRCTGKGLFYSRAEYKFDGRSGEADVEPLGSHCSRAAL